MPKLSRIGLNNSDTEILQQLASLEIPVTTVEQLLEREPFQLAEELKISPQAVEIIRYKASLSFLQLNDTDFSNDSLSTPNRSQFGTQASSQAGASSLSFLDGADTLCSELAEARTAFSTGSISLDALLGNGVQSHVVTELVGQQGTGKTQLCITAAVIAAASGVRVLYMDASNSADARRFSQIAGSRFGKQDVKAILDRIEIRCIGDVYNLLDNLSCLNTSEQSEKKALVIVDSVAACLSPLLGSDHRLVPIAHGHGLMATVGQTLARCASHLGAAVLVVNNTVADRDGGQRHGVKAALGISWTYASDVKVLFTERAEGIMEALLLKHPLKTVGEDVNGAQCIFSVDQYGINDLTFQAFSGDDALGANGL